MSSADVLPLLLPAASRSEVHRATTPSPPEFHIQRLQDRRIHRIWRVMHRGLRSRLHCPCIIGFWQMQLGQLHRRFRDLQ